MAFQHLFHHHLQQILYFCLTFHLVCECSALPFSKNNRQQSIVCVFVCLVVLATRRVLPMLCNLQQPQWHHPSVQGTPGRLAFNGQPFPSATRRPNRGENVLLLSLFDQVLGNSWVSRGAMQLVLRPYKAATQWGCLSRKSAPLCPRDNSGKFRLWQQRSPLLSVLFFKVSLSLNGLSSLVKKQVKV